MLIYFQFSRIGRDRYRVAATITFRAVISRSPIYRGDVILFARIYATLHAREPDSFSLSLYLFVTIS